MKIRDHYNVFAGQNRDRLAALSDGIFAIAMTLLVLDLRVPAGKIAEQLHDPKSGFLWDRLGSESDFWNGIVFPLAPRLEVYLTSFLLLGIFWVGQQTQINHVAHTDRTLTWLHLAFLLVVSLVPFSNALLADFITIRSALFIYWLNIMLLGVLLFATLRYSWKAKLYTEELTYERYVGSSRRIIIYQSLYLLAFLLCFISTYVSIALLVLFQLNSAIAPRFLGLNRV